MSTIPFDRARLLEIASTFGTPTYVYSEALIRSRIRDILDAFEGMRLLYAMKANSHPWILKMMAAEGVGIDAVSPAEALVALACGHDPGHVFYSPNNVSDEELDWAWRNNFVVNFGELQRIESFAKGHPGAEICVRLNLNIGAGHHEHVVTGGTKSMFGIPGNYLEQVLNTTRQHGVRVVGIHQHIGSGSTDPQPLVEGIETIAEVARQIDGLRFVNMGGGFGVSYEPDQTPLDLKQVASGADAALSALANSGVEVWFEPGRFLVAEAGVLLVRTNSIKQTADRTFAGTDSGMNHLIRPSLYDAFHGIYNLSNDSADESVFDVVGNICETGDFFARHRRVSEIREGDYLAILDAGAYAMSMATHYNLRPLPAEVALLSTGEARLISARSTAEEVANDILQRDVSATN
ncbi:MAG: diaminopimelate decarboxylase [Bacteroidetes bacterium]|nr:diaminopimelate decarboxylase [Bacteroidota bacterium]